MKLRAQELGRRSRGALVGGFFAWPISLRRCVRTPGVCLVPRAELGAGASLGSGTGCFLLSSQRAVLQSQTLGTGGPQAWLR